MPITIGLPLDLPDVWVLAIQVLRDSTLLIEVESTLGTAQCHCCGREIDRFHGFDRPLRWRHLPVLGREVLIEIRPKRYRCPSCEGSNHRPDPAPTMDRTGQGLGAELF